MVKFLDIRGLKRWVSRCLGAESRCRSVILLEPDYILPEEFVSKLGVWLKLYDLESRT